MVVCIGFKQYAFLYCNTPLAQEIVKIGKVGGGSVRKEQKTLAELAVVIKEVGKIIKLAAYKVGSGSRYYNRVKIGGYFTHDIIGNSFYFVVIRL